jgi:tungstate transport system ATP-binding protein
MSKEMFNLDRVTRSYDQRFALEVESLRINKGERLVLVGPSGAGKSTLLRLLNFLEPPTSGSIWFEGTSYSREKMPPLSETRKVTTVFQSPLLMSMSVLDNVCWGLRLRKVEHPEGKAVEALELVGMAAFAGDHIRCLSGGEAQRIALARAIVLSTDVLLLDEPTANLDPYNVSLIESIVLKLNQEKGTTIVMVTHNVFQAHRLGTQAALLLDGRIVEHAPVEKFFNRPEDTRTSAFTRGEMVY